MRQSRRVHGLRETPLPVLVHSASLHVVLSVLASDCLPGPLQHVLALLSQVRAEDSSIGAKRNKQGKRLRGSIRNKKARQA